MNIYEVQIKSVVEVEADSPSHAKSVAIDQLYDMIADGNDPHTIVTLVSTDEPTVDLTNFHANP